MRRHEELLRAGRVYQDRVPGGVCAGDKVTETGAVVQAQHLAASEGIRPVTEQPAAAEKSEAIPSPLPAPALTLDQAINFV